eukprot:RCo005961
MHVLAPWLVPPPLSLSLSVAFLHSFLLLSLLVRFCDVVQGPVRFFNFGTPARCPALFCLCTLHSPLFSLTPTLPFSFLSASVSPQLSPPPTTPLVVVVGGLDHQWTRNR